MAFEDTDLIIQFLDVGQGDGIYIEFPKNKLGSRKSMLVDLGSLKNKKTAGNDAVKYLVQHTKFKDKKQTMDYLVLTHADSDHHNLLYDFFELMDIMADQVYVGDDPSEFACKASDVLTNRIVIGGKVTKVVPDLCPIALGVDAFGGAFGGANVSILMGGLPPAEKGPDSGRKKEKAWLRNTKSIILRIEYLGFVVLLTGDATRDTERALMARLQKGGKLTDLHGSVLKMAHHGSARTSNAWDWIKAIGPAFVFVSSDRAGSIDGENRTGQRNPQELTFDIVRQVSATKDQKGQVNTGLAQSIGHEYVSSFDPADYTTDYAKAQASFDAKEALKEKEKHGVKAARWLSAKTTQALFTTLAFMGEKDGGEADVGVQYQVLIRAPNVKEQRENAVINVSVTDFSKP